MSPVTFGTCTVPPQPALASYPTDVKDTAGPSTSSYIHSDTKKALSDNCQPTHPYSFAVHTMPKFCRNTKCGDMQTNWENHDHAPPPRPRQHRISRGGRVHVPSSPPPPLHLPGMAAGAAVGFAHRRMPCPSQSNQPSGQWCMHIRMGRSQERSRIYPLTRMSTSCMASETHTHRRGCVTGHQRADGGHAVDSHHDVSSLGELRSHTAGADG